MIEIKKEKSKEPGVMSVSEKKPEAHYPWGTQFTLKKELVEKIPGLANARIGQKVTLTAEAYVKRVDMAEGEDLANKRFDVELQFTAIDVKTGKAKPGSSEQLGDIMDKYEKDE